MKKKIYKTSCADFNDGYRFYSLPQIGAYG